jgi:hypothetical protein
MGASVARQCSRNRSLTPMNSPDPQSWPRRAERVERTRRKTWSRARSEVLLPYTPRPSSGDGSILGGAAAPPQLLTPLMRYGNCRMWPARTGCKW